MHLESIKCKSRLLAIHWSVHLLFMIFQNGENFKTGCQIAWKLSIYLRYLSINHPFLLNNLILPWSLIVSLYVQSLCRIHNQIYIKRTNTSIFLCTDQYTLSVINNMLMLVVGNSKTLICALFNVIQSLWG